MINEEELKREEEMLKEQSTPTTEEQSNSAEENAAAADDNATNDKEGAETEEQPAEPSLEEQVEQLKKELLYKVAEFENYRKRVIKEKADLISMGGKGLMLALLPVIDDLDRAEEHISRSEDVEALKEGVMMISQKLRTTLQQQGLEVIEAKGEKFDTDLHEAVTMFPAPEESLKGCVIDCIQQGYKLNGNVIRHAKVVVGQ